MGVELLTRGARCLSISTTVTSLFYLVERVVGRNQGHCFGEHSSPPIRRWLLFARHRPVEDNKKRNHTYQFMQPILAQGLQKLSFLT